MLAAHTILLLALGQVLEPTPQDQGIRVTHDYCADLVAMAPAAPADQCAWPEYLKVIVALGCIPDEIADMPKPGDAGWAPIEAYLKSHGPALEQLRRATQIPVLGYPLSTSIDPQLLALRFCPKYDCHPEDPKPQEKPPRVSELAYPYIGKFRGFTRLLSCDVQFASTLKDGDRVSQDLDAILGLSRQVCDHDSDMADLVSMAITNTALALINQILADAPGLIPDARLRSLLAALAQSPLQGRARPRVNYIRYEMLDFLQRAYSDDGSGDGHLTMQGVREYDQISAGDDPTSAHTLENLLNGNLIYAGHFFAAAAKRKEITSEFDRRADPARWHGPMWAWDRWPDEMPARDSQESKEYKEKFPILGILMPDLKKMAVSGERVLQLRDAARVALALELKRRASGEFPASLQALVPDLLERIPADRFTGDPLCYTIIDGRATIYSRGPNLHDDGGRANPAVADTSSWYPPRATRPEDDPAPGGDWVLFEIKR